MNQEFYTYELPNSIRAIHRQVRSNVSHCALIVDAGSRDEMPSEYGLAHFTEHALFKGTHKRRAAQVNCRLENLGGELNAFTTKEETTIHATTLRRDFAKAVEIIADVAFHSTYPDKELDIERDVILDEINTYKDSPSELIYDTFEEMLFAGSELGHGILGEQKLIKKFNSQSIRNFTSRTHTTDKMVFSTIGSFSPKVAESIALKYFGEIEQRKRENSRVAPTTSPRFEHTINKHTHQTHCVIGSRAYSINQPERLALALLVNTLGGPAANSKLNVLVREQHGLSYNTEASYTPYSDCGVMAIYFSSDHNNASKCIELIHQQMQDFCTNKLTTRALSMAKRQFIGQLAISMESNEGYMLGAGRSYLLHNDIDTMEQVYKKIEAITAEQILEVANYVFHNTSQLIYK